MAFDYRSVVVALKANVKAWVAGMTEAGASVTTLKGVAEDFAAGNYDPKIGIDDTRARTALDALKADLDDLDHHSATPKVNLDGTAESEAELSVLEGRLDEFSHKRYEASVGVNGTERASRQTSFLVDAIATLGPAAVASSAVAVGAIGALGASMLAAGGASGVLGLAVAGQVAQMKKQETAITAATKALDGQTKGTAAYHQALEKVNALQAQFNTQFGPAADSFAKFQTTWHGFLADTAGSSDSVIAKALDLASAILPKLEGIVAAAGGSVSKLLDDLRKFTQGPEAGAMLAFFQQEGPAAIEAFGLSIGNIGKGFVSLLMAFAPMQDGILGGLQSLTKGFADWAAQVGQTQGFQNFLAYIAKTGPRVLDALGAIAGALLAVLKAAAPIGSATLPIITELANMLAVIANSPAGPTLIGIALALTAVNRALVVMAAIKATPVIAGLTGIGSGVGIAGAKAAAAKAGFLGAGIGLQVLASHVDSSQTAIKGGLDIISGALLGFGLSGGNPIGAVIGGAAGALELFVQKSQDAAAAQKELDDAAQKVSDTINQQNGAISRSTLPTLIQSLVDSGVADAAGRLGINLDKVTQAAILGGQSQQDLAAGAKDAQDALDALNDSTSRYGRGSAGAYALVKNQHAALTQNANDYQLVAAAVDAYQKHLQAAADRILLINKLSGEAAAEAEGGVQNVRAMGGAYDDLGRSIGGVAAATRAATAATDAYGVSLGVVDNQIAKQSAFLAYKQSILDTEAALKANTGVVAKGSAAYITLRNSLLSQASTTVAYAKTLKDGSVAQTEFEKTGTAALEKVATQFYGSKRAADAWIRTLGLIPPVKKTQVGLDGTAKATDDADSVKHHVEDVPTDWVTRMGQVGADGVIANADRVAAAVRRIPTTWTTHINVVNSGSTSVPFGVNGATGKYIASGPGTKTSDSIPAWVSWGEYIHQAASVDKYGLAFHHAINNMTLPVEFVRAAGFAGGGQIGSQVTDSMTRATSVSVHVTSAQPVVVKIPAGPFNVKFDLGEGKTLTGVMTQIAAGQVDQDRAHHQNLQDMWI